MSYLISLLSDPHLCKTQLISGNNGLISDSHFTGANNDAIIHIQDAHGLYSVQMAIFHIINELIDKYQLDIVAIEGGVGQLDTAPYSLRPNDETKVKVLQTFMKSGRLDGPGYAHMMSHSGFTFWGAGDAALHDRNEQALAKVREDGTSNIHLYNTFKGIIECIKAEAYSGELLMLESQIFAYKREELAFQDYLLYLLECLRAQGIDEISFPTFLHMVDILKHKKAKANGLDHRLLFSEVEDIEEKLKESYITNDDQRELSLIGFILSILKDMFELKADDKTLQFYRSHRKYFTVSHIREGILSLAKTYGVLIDNDLLKIDINFSLANIEEFYNLAEAREIALLNNTLNLMRSKKEQVAVLVAGGFHTGGITGLCRQKNISYVVITPTVPEAD
jgi:hypothetical protein